MRRSKLEKTKEAEERNAARAKRSNSDQLSVLDARLGKGVGAVKERARLKAIIENPPESPKKKRKTKTEDSLS